MKGAVTLFICATIFMLGAAQNQVRCPKDETTDVLLPHERCNRFYQCAAGKLIAQRCAANLKFNIETQLCDWPDRVECGNRNDDESEEIKADDPETGNVNDNPVLAPIICAEDGSDGILVSHEKCNKFYICSGGLTVAMTCPPNLVYNPFKEQCDWPENVRCRDGLPEPDIGNNDEESSEGNYDPSQAPAICAEEGSDGVLVAHEHCNKFYKCFNGLPVTLNCPQNLLYNPRREQCDWPNNVKCGKRIIPDENCINEDEPSKDEGEGNSDPSEAAAICAADGSNGVLVAHEQCNKFYKCAEGIPVALQCQLNLLYNPINEQCDWPQNVDCANRII